MWQPEGAWVRAFCYCFSLFLAACGGSGDGQRPSAVASDEWIPAWIASPTDADSINLLAGTMLRQTITAHTAGSRARLQLSNRLGTETMPIAQMTLGDQPLTFAGAQALDLAPGAVIYSDPIPLSIRAFDRLAVTLTLAADVATVSRHAKAYERLEIALPGAPFVEMPIDRYGSWYAISALEVQGGAAQQAVVAFGDSITEGYVPAVPCANVVTEPSIYGADVRYPDFLQRRLLDAGRDDLVVVNAGISGNRVNADGFSADFGPAWPARIAHDVLAYPNVRTVILLGGINDLGLQVLGPDAQALIDGIDAVVRSLQDGDKHVVLGTITPGRGFCEGALANLQLPVGVLSGSPAVDEARQAVNAWIRTASSADAIVDFDQCLRDPARPSYLADPYDSGDHVHPSVAGYEAMAQCVNPDDL
jgi:lysophospholipase L1-like esterase